MRSFLKNQTTKHNKGIKMNTKKENQLRLQTLINHRIRISNTDYHPSYYGMKKIVLKVIDEKIEKRTLELRKIV